MENEFETSPQKSNNTNNNNDTLIFLITEFFLNSSLSTIESSSFNQDIEISNQMDKLYQNLQSLESFKSIVLFEEQFNSQLNFSTSTFSQFSSKLNNSVVKDKNHYHRLFNADPIDKLKNQKKILVKPNPYTINKKPAILQGLSLTEANSNTTSKKKGKFITESRKTSYNRGGSSNNNMNRTINYTTYNYQSNPATQRISFKFEPKKKMLMNNIKNAEIQLDNHLCSTPKSNSKGIRHKEELMSLSYSTSKMVKKKMLITKLGKVMVDEENKYEKILKTIVSYLPLKNNTLNGISWGLRKVYLEELINRNKKKLKMVMKENNEDCITTTTSVVDNEGNMMLDKEQLVQQNNNERDKGNSLDKKMEIEILNHIEKKLSDFLLKKTNNTYSFVNNTSNDGEKQNMK